MFSCSFLLWTNVCRFIHYTSWESEVGGASMASYVVQWTVINAGGRLQSSWLIVIKLWMRVLFGGRRRLIPAECCRDEWHHIELPCLCLPRVRHHTDKCRRSTACIQRLHWTIWSQAYNTDYSLISRFTPGASRQGVRKHHKVLCWSVVGCWLLLLGE